MAVPCDDVQVDTQRFLDVGGPDTFAHSMEHGLPISLLPQMAVGVVDEGF